MPTSETKEQNLENLGLAVERHSIDHIPASQRHGSVTSLFTIWFGANMHMTTIVTGALGTILGLPLPWALLALLLGNLFGAVFMALHSAQGPKLGIPQMIQSRAQFGFHGAILPLVLLIFGLGEASKIAMVALGVHPARDSDFLTGVGGTECATGGQTASRSSSRTCFPDTSSAAPHSRSACW